MRPRLWLPLIIDWAAKYRISLVQFVDDSFVLQSTWRGLTRACQALNRFKTLWRHSFAAGKKGPGFVLFGQTAQDVHPPLYVGNMLVQHLTSFNIRGVPVENYLNFNLLLQSVTAKLKNAAPVTFTTMNDLGFGLPFQIDQIGQRVDPKALYGCELPASDFLGWPTVFKRLNDAQYHMLGPEVRASCYLR